MAKARPVKRQSISSGRADAQPMKIRRVEVASFALSMAVIHTIVAFFAGVILTVFFAAFLPKMHPLFYGIFVMVYPILGFIGGFIGGAIYAFIYNVLAEKYESIRFRGESR